jgi:hypothetical protein
MLAFDRMPEWMDEWENASFTSEVRTPGDKYRAGASAHVNEKYGKLDIEITEVLEKEKIMARSKSMGKGRVTMTLTYLLKPIEAGTKLTYAMEYEMLGGILGKGHAEKGVETSLNNLKRILER